MIWHCERRITKCICLLRARPYPAWYTRELHALLRADRKDLQTDDSSCVMVFFLSFLQCALEKKTTRLGRNSLSFSPLTILYLIFLSTIFFSLSPISLPFLLSLSAPLSILPFFLLSSGGN